MHFMSFIIGKTFKDSKNLNSFEFGLNAQKSMRFAESVRESTRNAERHREGTRVDERRRERWRFDESRQARMRVWQNALIWPRLAIFTSRFLIDLFHLL